MKAIYEGSVPLSMCLSVCLLVSTLQAESVIELVVVDHFGGSLRQVQVREIDPGPGEVIRTWPRGTTVGSLPEGKHTLRIEVAGFQHELLDLNIGGVNIFHVVGMKLGSMSGEDPRVKVGGRLPSSFRIAGLQWVRAVPTFSSSISEAKVDGTGRFVFRPLDAGKYVFQFVASGVLSCTVERDVAGVTIDLTPNLSRCSIPKLAAPVARAREAHFPAR